MLVGLPVCPASVPLLEATAVTRSTASGTANGTSSPAAGNASRGTGPGIQLEVTSTSTSNPAAGYAASAITMLAATRGFNFKLKLLRVPLPPGT